MNFRIVTLPTLSWFAVPLLAGPLLASQARRGEAIARVVLVGLALGALQVGADTVVPAELVRYAAREPGNALFVSLSIGLIVGAVGPWPWPLDRWPVLTGMPLLLAAAVPLALGPVRWLGLLLGVVLAALPLFAGTVIPGGGDVVEPDLREAAPGWWLAITIGIALAEPLVLLLLLPLPWLLPGHRRGWPAPPPSRRVMPLVALVCGIGLAWLALTIAGDPFVRLDGYIVAAPLSAGAERLLAVLALGMVLALAAPWPLGRLAPLLVPVPAVVVLAHRFATDLAPQGIAAWLPAAAMLLVPVGVLEAFRRRWAGALAAVAVVGGLLGGAGAFAGAMVLALAAVTPSLRRRAASATADRVTFFSSPWLAVPVAAALAAVIAALLRAEVVLATLLTAGLATALARRGSAA